MLSFHFHRIVQHRLDNKMHPILQLLIKKSVEQPVIASLTALLLGWTVTTFLSGKRKPSRRAQNAKVKATEKLAAHSSEFTKKVSYHIYVLYVITTLNLGGDRSHKGSVLRHRIWAREQVNVLTTAIFCLINC